MTLWAVASKHGSPGATTFGLALSVAWPAAGRPKMFVEADPNGGVLAARFDSRLRLDKTIADLAVASRHGWNQVASEGCARELWAGVPVVVASPSAEQTRAALALRSDQMASSLAGSDMDVIVDVGRLDAGSPALPLAQRAVTTVLVSRCRLEDALLLAPLVGELSANGVAPALVLVTGEGRADRDASPEEVVEVAGAALLGILPFDGRAAGVFAGSAGGGRRLERSLWWRSVREIASVLSSRSPARTVPPNPVAPTETVPGVGTSQTGEPDRSHPPPVRAPSSLTGTLGSLAATAHQERAS